MECADRGDWADAVAAFSAAVDAAADPQEHSPPDVMALVLGNLASACFRAGSLADGIRHAQRACAIRVALAGEDATSAARARSDLAVMLCAAGRGEEAAALIERAIANVERSVGEDDLRLVSLFENAARVALSLGHLDAATAPLDRLHSLLTLHDLPTGRADELQARVAMARARSGVLHAEELPPPAAHLNDALTVTPVATTPVLPEPTIVEIAIVETAIIETAIIESAMVETPIVEMPSVPHGDVALELDDQPLRDAVAVTDVLLRTTPRGVAIIREEAAPPTALADALPDDVELTATFAEELERDLQATLPTARPASIGEPLAAPALGFAIEHGFTGYEEHHMGADASALSLELTLADTVAPAPLHAEASLPIEVPRIVEPTWSPVSPPARRTTPRDIAIVLPSPHDGVPTVAGAFGGTSLDIGSDVADGESSSDADDASMEDASGRARRPFGAALRAGRAAAPQSSHGTLIAAAITIAAGAAATWFFLQSGR